jgi:hypothetical protein
VIDAARITFTDPDAADEPGHVRVRSVTAMGWWAKRPARAERYQLDSLPTLDEAWTVYLCFLDGVPPALEAICRYTEDARQGRWIDSGPPEHALQAIYLALAQQLLLVERDQRRFLEEANALFDVVASGRKPADEARFQRYVSMLVDDQRLYRQDLKRSQVWKVRVPPREVTLLVLDRPSSTQFKLWARRQDDHALLLVRPTVGALVLSADPSAKLRVDWAAPVLSKLDTAPWYAGERHAGTLIASPREGTKLTFEDVRKALGARRVRRRVWPWVASAVALLVVCPGVCYHPPPSGSKGEPLDSVEVINLLKRPDGPKSFGRYAMVIGVCGYTGEHELEAPCDDARAVRDLLTSKLGYPRENVLFFVDKPTADERVDGAPDAPTLKLAVERFRDRFPQAGPQSSFVFYYSGHGGYEKGARKDFGVLQPAGYFEHSDAPIADRGWDMQELVDDLRKGVPSKHVMMLLDACYSGWAVGAKGDYRLNAEVWSLWQERAEVVLTAGTRGQRAWEDEGLSMFTQGLLEGLRGGADSNFDKIITDEELAAFLLKRVPAAVQERKHADQTPQFFRFDEALPKSGQFLFLL